MKIKLPDSISSTQDLTTLQLEIKDYARWLSHNSIKQKFQTKATSEQPKLSADALEVVKEWHSKLPLSQSNFDELIASLQKIKETAPTISITLSAPPSNGLKKTLASWCRNNISPNILISFQFNSTLAGGMVVRSGSHIFDWSFRRQILESRQHFPEILRRV